MQYNIYIWERLFPKVKPYYAVKCNNDNNVINTLINNNWNFDCASISEINQVRNGIKMYNKNIKEQNKKYIYQNINNINKSEIIFANPVKWEDDIKTSKKYGINLYTLDSINELEKLNNFHPDSKYLLRIGVNDEHSKCRLNDKFGMKEQNITNFINIINNYKPKMVGLAFHVGSNCMSYNSYKDAINLIETIISKYDKFSDNFKIIDIGGGFRKDLNLLNNISKLVNQKIEKFPYINWIAEPGRLMVNDAYDLYTKIVGIDDNRVFINNSIYSDLNCILFDHVVPDFNIIRDNKVIYNYINNNIIESDKNTDENYKTYSKTYYKTYNIFGSTCDSIDILYKDIILPKLQLGDTIKFLNMGAYTISSRSNFNGIPCAEIYNKY